MIAAAQACTEQMSWPDALVFVVFIAAMTYLIGKFL